MRHIFLTLSFFSFLFASCQTKTINFDDALKSQQTTFPSGQDKKWKAIKSLEIYKDNFVCDSLLNIYMSIDTSKRGFGMYYDVIFNTLVSINTTKSAQTIEKIYSTKLPKFLSQTAITNLSSHSQYYLLFPGILNSLKPDLMNAHWILKLLEKGISQNRISKSNLETYLPKLESFYSYTKVQRDEPAPKEGLILNIYYWISNPLLARCLTPINNNKIARKILTELFNDSKKAQSSNEKELSWEAFKALDTTLQSDAYFSILCKDLTFRQKVYDYLNEKNKLSLFPVAFNSQQSLSEMICVSSRNLRRHDTNKPDNISFIGTKEINNEFYYFYWICWWDNCKSNSVVVVGPQPFDKAKFNENPKLKGESIKENIEKKDLQITITNFKVE